MIAIKILNLDQSSKASGYSLYIDKKLKYHGTLFISNEKLPVFDRMKEMADMIEKVIEKYNPDYICFENTQLQFGNVEVFRTLSQLQGVIIKLLLDKSIGFTIVNPSEWRKVCGIKGKKREEQKLAAIKYVEETFGLIMSEDEAEATCMGVWSNKNITKE